MADTSVPTASRRSGHGPGSRRAPSRWSDIITVHSCLKCAMTVQASKNYSSGQRAADDPRIALLRQLVDPLRLRVIDRLSHAGPASVTRLAEELGVPLPQLSNHLRRLREAGLIAGRREGRHVIYELADPGLELLTPLLDSITGRMSPPPQAAARDLPSRTCYDHLAGPIGVAIYRALRDRDAVTARADGLVELGPNADAILMALGVDPALSPRGRQRFAFECLDATQHAPHLAGALGDALAASLTERRWIQRDPDSRHYSVTAAGRRKLRDALGIVDPPTAPPAPR
ncbi:MAG: ArsR/SmtB family transcription factor [Solirubrobacteraceae bacterium]